MKEYKEAELEVVMFDTDIITSSCRQVCMEDAECPGGFCQEFYF